MVGFNTMADMYLFGLVSIIILLLMLWVDSILSKVPFALGFLFMGSIFLVSIWFNGHDSLSARFCVATVTAQEGWENMSIADLHSAANEAVADQPVSPHDPERVEKKCATELEAQARPTTSEN